MKYPFFILCCFLLSFRSYAQQPSFQVCFSEPLAVFVFAEQLSEQQPDNPFKKVFNKSTYHTEACTRLIAELDTLPIDYFYRFTDFPYGQKVPGMTKALLKKNLILAADLNDFKIRSAGLIPNSSLIRIADILAALTPVYRELIYEPNKAKFEQQLKDIRNYVSSRGIPRFFETGIRFYHSEWDPSLPFYIAFYPLPDSRGFTAEAFYNNAVSAIQTDLRDYNILLSVMMHEIFHILYDEQSLAVKNDLEGYFRENPSHCSRYAYMLLNEVLATALGNGYVYEQLNGKADTTDWYNWRYINLMAKKIYPELLEYIHDQRAIDQKFVNHYIRLYEQNYAGWIDEPDNTLTFRYVLSDKVEDIRLIRKYFPYCSVSEAEGEVTARSIEKMKNTPLTKVIIISRDNAATLKMLRQTFPELKRWQYRADREFCQSIFLDDKTQLYIINQLTTPTAQLLEPFVLKRQ